MRRILAILLLVSLAFAGDTKPLWVAVGAPDLLKAIEPLAAHRRAQGFKTVLAPKVGELKPDYLVLVGDVDTIDARAMELYRWRGVQKKTFVSDADRADRDGDLLPDFPVGRIPARSPEEVAIVVRKTVAYEQQAPTTLDLRLVVWAGAPGYGGMVDAMATQMLVNTVRQYAPRWADPWLISADLRQALCGWPPDQPRTFARYMRLGSLLNAVAAHGNADGIFSMNHQGKGVWFTAAHARKYFATGAPTAPLVFLACNCGEFDRERGSIAEVMLFLPGGPVATIGASTESHPLTNFFTGVGMLKSLSKGEPRLGALWLAGQRAGAKERSALVESMLKNVEGKLEAEIDVAKLRRDQQRMYVLLGDPALRLPLPGKLEAKLEKTETGWRWSAKPVAGATLHIAYRPVPPRMVAPLLKGEAADYHRRFLEANSAEAFRGSDAFVVTGPWQGTLNKPGDLRLAVTGPGIFRVAVLRAVRPPR